MGENSSQLEFTEAGSGKIPHCPEGVAQAWNERLWVRIPARSQSFDLELPSKCCKNLPTN
jgi:hypothetical protein